MGGMSHERKETVIMAEAKKATEPTKQSDPTKDAPNSTDELPDDAKTAAMRRREAKEERVAGEMAAWEKLNKAKEKEEAQKTE